MSAMIDDSALHAHARTCAAGLRSPDKKQLRFNEIVATAKQFYSGDPMSGVRELIEACDRSSSLYVSGRPMHETLEAEYKWMVPE